MNICSLMIYALYFLLIARILLPLHFACMLFVIAGN